MGAVMNGIVLHGGYMPFGGTFLVFSDYARSSLRMASIIETGSIFVLTHDSIGLGEDGPTHQPVEHLASLRMIPRMEVWRPCDTAETWVAWAAAIRRRSCADGARADAPGPAAAAARSPRSSRPSPAAATCSSTAAGSPTAS